MDAGTYVLKIYRGTPGKQYWEQFEFKRNYSANVISALMEIQKRPVNRKGEITTPVAWEQGCLEEVCGSCSMLINGKPRQACTALIEEYIRDTGSNVIALAPFTKFPLIRDLCVNRDSMFQALVKIRGWISVDGTEDQGEFGQPISQEVQQAMYVLSTCMTCGCCSESCPQVNHRSEFMGPAAMSQIRYFNTNPTGKLEKSERLRVATGQEGIAGCGNAQNCVRVCPKGIPLTESLSLIGREATKQALKDLIGLPDA
ncbi:MAG: succinate dehydrogenase iron-sulfur subunit [Chlamydiae bacterium RIFCSPHIGHO2_12_FULL_44_59]|nr:MAG: succinate dehydrogenase iron-sulfur subunit [Chlamydiae bacterium RIFCSPHIGHO2_01_FULL_44_39]OGN61204.1 MAG: succinate dehydrogenase iron-sulfur subunit [Chlamydiae bacterium RIFCSPHIGHO2_12_FULL_44_59]OGN65674.1 MAG: succinate dehydrogenase iron-sulfur subunit [Chlamydiae bacterium RIFCSPLOWO2_01_FULL_44_52]OGN68151.1 MAG: succinate dehydrogenase iron-sulfur subunit [Chlamydiae bacterium RIFCSPLOWO2_02_FULL_45_22]OGN69039.1 MAG: succinate dehydrogenase iron-sulfur subunit [Chlamydiae b